MPAFGCTRATVAFQVSTFLSGGQPGCLLRIYADVDHVKFFADAPFDILQTFDHPIEHQRAEHRTFVVTENENDGLVVEETSEPERVAIFIAKNRVEGQR